MHGCCRCYDAVGCLVLPVGDGGLQRFVGAGGGWIVTAGVVLGS